METCASANYWARELSALGHQVRLMPPHYVKPYVKRSKNQARRQLGEEWQQLRPAQPLAKHHLAVGINSMQLEYRLGQVEAEHRNVFHRVLLSTHPGKTAGRVERRPRHQLRTFTEAAGLERRSLSMRPFEEGSTKSMTILVSPPWTAVC